MNVIVSKSAQDWVAKKGGVVTIQLFTPLTQCCVGQALEVEFLFESPKHIEPFIRKEVGGTTFFVEKMIPLKANTLQIDCFGIGSWKTLQASGIARFS